MSPPAIAEAIVTITAPPHDYESILGDLHEEHARRSQWDGRARADAWYWAQALRSIPWLLSYSRVHRSNGARFATWLIVFVAIIAMMLVNELLDDTIRAMFRTAGTIGHWTFLLAGWLDAACFGVLLAAMRPSHGMRFVLVSACTLLAFIATPILLERSSPLSASAWTLVLGASVSMTLGGAVYHLIRRHFSCSHL